MTFEEYVNTIWEKAHPFASFTNEMSGVVKQDSYCLQKIDWIQFNIKNNSANEIGKEEISDLFQSILQYFIECIIDTTKSYCCFTPPGSILLSFFKICNETFLYSKEKLEKMDDLLIDKMKNNFDKIYREKPYHFDIIFSKVVSWYIFRQEFYKESQIGFSPLELYIPYNFYSIFEKEMLEIRNNNFDASFRFAEYSLWVYGNAKNVSRQYMVGDIIKYIKFAILCCRNALVAAQKNGYFEYEESIKNRIRSIQSDIISTPTVFISYNWGKEALVEEIQKCIEKFAIVKRDKNEIKFGNSITEFMNTILQEDFALIILSDAYLKSDACMYELTTLFKKRGADNFNQKVLFLVCDDALSIYNSEGRGTYIEYWDNRYKNLNAKIGQLSPECSIEITQSIQAVSFIRLQIGGFLDYIKDHKNFDEKNVVPTISSYLNHEGKIGRNVVEDMFLYMKYQSSDEK